MEKIRWAILGAGRIAHKFASDIQQVPNASLLAIASRDSQRAQDFAQQYEIPQAIDYDALYASKDVDAVYIATPHNFHFEQALACIRSGKAVLCEKPITINDAQCRELVAAAQEHRVFLMEALWTYFLPAMQQAKAWIEAGRIGAIQTIHANFCYLMDYDPEGRLYNPELAGGALLDLGIYPIAFTTYFMNRKPDKLTATAFLSDTGVDASTAMIFQYGKTPAFLYASMTGRSQNTGVIVGEKGRIELPDFFKASEAVLYDENGSQADQFTDSRTSFGYHFEIAEATRCIVEKRLESAVVPHQLSINIQELLTTVRRQIGLQYPQE